MSTQTINENDDSIWARQKVQEWVDSAEGMYGDTQRLSRVHPIALGVYVMWVLYGDGQRDFTSAELAEMDRHLTLERDAQALLEQVDDERPDSPDNTEHLTRGYVADSLARKDVQNIDWTRLALDLLDLDPADPDLDPDDEDVPQWVADLV